MCSNTTASGYLDMAIEELSEIYADFEGLTDEELVNCRKVMWDRLERALTYINWADSSCLGES